MLMRFDVPRTYDSLLNDVMQWDVRPSTRSFSPAVDVTEQENELVVRMELPGVKKDDVKIVFENSVLTISGERKPYEIPDDAKILLNEMRVRQFSRSIEFGAEIDTNRIAAEMTNGILQIVLPKAEEARPRTIEVK